MTLSVNEIEMLAQKAARGGGAYAAQAAHFGKAVAVHLAAGRDEADVIHALRALPDGEIQTLPFRVTLDPSNALHMSYAMLREPPGSRPEMPTRLTCSDALRAQLQALADQTLVPASEASRQSGAGAGLTDSD